MKLPISNRGERAFGMVVVIILIGVFTATLTIGLIETIKTVVPGSGPDIHVVTHVTVTNYCACGCGMVAQGTAFDGTATCGCRHDAPASDVITEPTTTFTLQYGMDTFGNVIIYAGTPWPESEGAAQPVAVIVPIDATATTVSALIYFSDGEVWLYSFNLETGIESSMYYDSWTPPLPEGTTVIIERSGDLVTWSGVLTNTVLPNSIWTWTDNSAPINAGYYRIKQ
jgi:hypothetical protein